MRKTVLVLSVFLIAGVGLILSSRWSVSRSQEDSVSKTERSSGIPTKETTATAVTQSASNTPLDSVEIEIENEPH